MVAACSASSTGLCQGSTITAVPSRSVLVRAASPGQQIEARRNLAEAGEMMLDDEDAVVAERLGLDDVVDLIAKALTAVEIGAAALGQALPNSPNFMTPCFASVGLIMHF